MKFSLLLGAFCLATGAQAAITFNFDTGANTDLGATHTYTSGPFTIFATAEPGGSGNHLFSKNLGGDEDGVGLTSDTSSENEITPGFFIQLDITSILGNNPLTVLIGSTTGNDQWQIFQTNTANSLIGAISMGTGTNESPVTINPTHTFLDVTAVSGNILLDSLSFSTPEPASLAMIGGGLAILGLVRRRRTR